MYHLEIPSQTNCDYKGKSDEYIGAVNINLNNLPQIKESERSTKFIRALFAIEVKKNTFKKYCLKNSTTANSQNENINNNNIEVKSFNLEVINDLDEIKDLK